MPTERPMTTEAIKLERPRERQHRFGGYVFFLLIYTNVCYFLFFGGHWTTTLNIVIVMVNRLQPVSDSSKDPYTSGATKLNLDHYRVLL